MLTHRRHCTQAILRGDIQDEDQVVVDVAPDAPPRLALSKAGGNSAPKASKAAEAKA